MELGTAGPSQVLHPPKPPPIPKKRRIRNAGISVLEDFAKNHPDSEPNHEQRRILLQKIHAIPGCEDFEAQKLMAWFRRRKTRAFSRQGSTLTKEAIQHLQTLYEAQQEFPSPKLISTWAVLLKVQPEDIFAWLETQNDLTGQDNVSFPHLPTPVSTSPEPYLGAASSHNLELSLKADPVSPFVPFFIPQHVQLQRLSQNSLLHAIREAISTPSLSSVKPRSAEEFNNMFNPYIEKINMIIDGNQVLPR